MPTVESPLVLTVFDKDLALKGFVGDPISLKVTPRHMAIGTLDLTVPANHRLLADLTAPGARITCDYRGEQIFSGPRRPLNGQGPTSAGTVTISYEDDIRLLWRLLGYPTPGNAVEDQPDQQDKRTGPAETVLKAFISANKGRDTTKTIMVVPTSGRGSTITVGIRMVPLADKLVDVCDKAGIGLSVRQVSGGLQVDCYTPATYPRNLTEEGGAVVNWSWSETAPSATRTVVGGPNTGTSREFNLVVDSAREIAWGDVIETLTDASSEELLADILDAGQTALADASEKGGFSLELSETDTFHYGGADGVRVGDLVTATVAGQARTDVVREATLLWDRQNGFKITPTVADRSDDPDRALIKVINKLRRGIRDLQSR